jgi:polysaccharide pyruvyl transferase WcaK-like protein
MNSENETIVSVVSCQNVYNFGDILLLDLMVQWIREYDDSYKINLPLADYYVGNWVHADMRSIRKVQKSDAVIFSGGGYFGEPNENVIEWGSSHYQSYGKIAETVLNSNIPVCVVGVGAGPITHEKYRLITRKLFDQASFVSLRDPVSYRFADDLTHEASLFETADYALTLSDTYFNNHNKPRDLVIHIDGISENAHNQLRQFFISRLGSIAEKYRVTLLNDGLKKMRWRDYIKLKFNSTNKHRALDLANVLAKHGVEVDTYSFEGDPFKLVDNLFNHSLVLTTKLHIGICAVAAGCNPISIPFHQKTPRFYKQIGLFERCLPLYSHSSTEINNFIDTKIERKKNLKLTGRLRKAIESSKKNKTLLLDFLDSYS